MTLCLHHSYVYEAHRVYVKVPKLQENKKCIYSASNLRITRDFGELALYICGVWSFQSKVFILIHSLNTFNVA